MRKHLHIPSKTMFQNDDFDLLESVTDFLTRTTFLVREKVDMENIAQFNQELGEALGEAVTYLYYTRKLRDEALAKGYEKYPKGSCNAEAQIALARQFASEEIRLHELIKDISDAIKVRTSVNQTLMNWRRVGA